MVVRVDVSRKPLPWRVGPNEGILKDRVSSVEGVTWSDQSRGRDLRQGRVPGYIELDALRIEHSLVSGGGTIWSFAAYIAEARLAGRVVVWGLAVANRRM